MFWEWGAWQQIVVYGFVTLALVVYALLSKIALFGRPILRQRWRVMLALLSPVLFIAALFLGVIGLGILGFVLAFWGVLTLFGWKRKKKTPRMHRFVIRFGPPPDQE